MGRVKKRSPKPRGPAVRNDTQLRSTAAPLQLAKRRFPLTNKTDQYTSFSYPRERSFLPEVASDDFVDGVVEKGGTRFCDKVGFVALRQNKPAFSGRFEGGIPIHSWRGSARRYFVAARQVSTTRPGQRLLKML
jgi:hypothetical protein